MSQNKHGENSSQKTKNHESEHCCGEEHKCGNKHKMIHYSIIAILVLSLLNLFFIAGVSMGVGSLQTQVDKLVLTKYLLTD